MSESIPVGNSHDARSKISDFIYATLKERIASGQLTAGERLYPDRIGREFSVSPTPVKEALAHLAAEQFVEVTPRRGCRVSSPSHRKIREWWELRYGLEALAGELAIRRLREGSLSEQSFEELIEIQKQIESDYDISSREHTALNATFHTALVRMSDNAHLVKHYMDIQLHTIEAWAKVAGSNWRLRLDAERLEHQAIINSLQRRDAAGFRMELWRHIERSLIGVLQDLDLQQQRQSPDSGAAERQN